MKRKYTSLFVLLIILISLLASCAGTDARTKVRSQNKVRAYERFLKDHAASNSKDIDKPGIHFYGKYLYVVINLTDSGGDRYPEWAAEKVTTTLYGYRAVNQKLVSDDEFYELAIRFELEEIIEGEWENLARIRVKEKYVRDFVEMQLEGI